MRRDNPYRRRLLEQLEAEYDAHGCELVKHIVDEYAPLLGMAPRGVPQALDAFLAEREGHWSPVGLIVRPEVVERMALAADAVEAFAIAKEAGIAPPTQRQFFRVYLSARAYPSLRRLERAENETARLAKMGLGRRACSECAASRGMGRLR